MGSKSKYLICRLCLSYGEVLVDICEGEAEPGFEVKETVEDLLRVEEVPLACWWIKNLKEGDGYRRLLGIVMWWFLLAFHMSKNHKLTGKVVPGSDLPWLVCLNCIGKLEDFNNFKFKCLSSNSAFIQRFTKSRSSTTTVPSSRLQGKESTSISKGGAAPSVLGQRTCGTDSNRHAVVATVGSDSYAGAEGGSGHNVRTAGEYCGGNSSAVTRRVPPTPLEFGTTDATASKYHTDPMMVVGEEVAGAVIKMEEEEGEVGSGLVIVSTASAMTAPSDGGAKGMYFRTDDPREVVRSEIAVDQEEQEEDDSKVGIFSGRAFENTPRVEDSTTTSCRPLGGAATSCPPQSVSRKKSSRVGRVNERQLRLLVDYMCAHSSFAAGKFLGPMGNEKAQAQWRTLTDRLNEYGRMKEPEQWKKTWRDLKRNVRAKAARIEAATKETGNKPVDEALNEIERKCMRIISSEVMEDIASIPEHCESIAGPSQAPTAVPMPIAFDDEQNCSSPITTPQCAAEHMEGIVEDLFPREKTTCVDVKSKNGGELERATALIIDAMKSREKIKEEIREAKERVLERSAAAEERQARAAERLATAAERRAAASEKSAAAAERKAAAAERMAAANE